MIRKRQQRHARRRRCGRQPPLAGAQRVREHWPRGVGGWLAPDARAPGALVGSVSAVQTPYEELPRNGQLRSTAEAGGEGGGRATGAAGNLQCTGDDSQCCGAAARSCRKMAYTPDESYGCVSTGWRRLNTIMTICSLVITKCYDFDHKL
jgi:hypothetical protein